MTKILMLPALLALSACAASGIGQPSIGLEATYNQSVSREPYDSIGAREKECRDHDHFDDCPYVTDVLDHVSKPGKRLVVVRSVAQK